jgi:hypothetical protein
MKAILISLGKSTKGSAVLKNATSAAGLRRYDGAQMQRSSMLIDHRRRLRATIASRDVEIESGDGVFAEGALENGGAVYLFCRVVSHFLILFHSCQRFWGKRCATLMSLRKNFSTGMLFPDRPGRPIQSNQRRIGIVVLEYLVKSASIRRHGFRPALAKSDAMPLPGPIQNYAVTLVS